MRLFHPSVAFARIVFYFRPNPSLIAFHHPVDSHRQRRRSDRTWFINESFSMSRKAVSKALLNLRAIQNPNIPTTIKNPERVAYRRMELIDVATKLFLERGFHNTSIRDIVRACSFNVASLYMYVSSKEDILYLETYMYRLATLNEHALTM